MWLYSCKVVVFGQTGCICRMSFLSGKLVVFGQNWLYLGKSGCIRAKVVVFRQGGFILAKVVIFLQSGCIQSKWLYLGKSG